MPWVKQIYFISLGWSILHQRIYLFILNVLLNKSMMPPVGLVTAPTKPFLTPLKKPVAPSFWAPGKKKYRVFDNWIKNKKGINSWNIYITRKNYYTHLLDWFCNNSCYATYKTLEEKHKWKFTIIWCDTLKNQVWLTKEIQNAAF